MQTFIATLFIAAKVWTNHKKNCGTYMHFDIIYQIIDINELSSQEKHGQNLKCTCLIERSQFKEPTNYSNPTM
jgi:hypothetical protein